MVQVTLCIMCVCVCVFPHIGFVILQSHAINVCGAVMAGLCTTIIDLVDMLDIVIFYSHLFYAKGLKRRATILRPKSWININFFFI